MQPQAPKPPPNYDALDPATGLPTYLYMGNVFNWLQLDPAGVYAWFMSISITMAQHGAIDAAAQVRDAAIALMDPNTYA